LHLDRLHGGGVLVGQLLEGHLDDGVNILVVELFLGEELVSL
jgi:hypothetical protein